MTENKTTTAGGFWKDRTFLTLVLGCVFIVGAGLVKYSDRVGVPEDAFFIEKLTWKSQAEVVLLGDSRIYMGVSPEDLSFALPRNPTVLNFAFSGVKYDDAYLNEALEVFKDDSDITRIAVIGVTPSSVLTVKKGDFPCGYLDARKELDELNAMDFSLRRIYPFFNPIEPKDLLYGFFPSLKKRRFYRNFHENGWMSGYRVPPRPGTVSIAFRSHMKTRRPVAPKRVEALVRFIKTCKERGIRVYAFRPPTCKAMVEAEDELTEFLVAKLPETLVEAGAVWLVPDPFKYDSFDDSHLSEDAAIQLSKDLGKMISEDLARTPDTEAP